MTSETLTHFMKRFWLGQSDGLVDALRVKPLPALAVNLVSKALGREHDAAFSEMTTEVDEYRDERLRDIRHSNLSDEQKQAAMGDLVNAYAEYFEDRESLRNAYNKLTSTIQQVATGDMPENEADLNILKYMEVISLAAAIYCDRADFYGQRPQPDYDLGMPGVNPNLFRQARDIAVTMTNWAEVHGEALVNEAEALFDTEQNIRTAHNAFNVILGSREWDNHALPHGLTTRVVDVMVQPRSKSFGERLSGILPHKRSKFTPEPVTQGYVEAKNGDEILTDIERNPNLDLNNAVIIRIPEYIDSVHNVSDEISRPELKQEVRMMRDLFTDIFGQTPYITPSMDLVFKDSQMLAIEEKLEAGDVTIDLTNLFAKYYEANGTIKALVEEVEPTIEVETQGPAATAAAASRGTRTASTAARS